MKKIWVIVHSIFTFNRLNECQNFKKLFFPERYSVSSQTSNKGAGQLTGVAGKAGNRWNDRKFCESYQLLNRTKRNINRLCLTKVSCHKVVRI